MRVEKLSPFHGAGASGWDPSSRLPPDQREINGSWGGTGKAGVEIGFSLVPVGCGDPGLPGAAFPDVFHPSSHVIPFQTCALPWEAEPSPSRSSQGGVWAIP